MIYEAGYTVVELHPATKGMNLNTAPELLKQEYSTYIENIMPDSLGEGKVRYGTASFANAVGEAPVDKIIKAFPFTANDGSKQQVLYYNGFQNFAAFTNLRIISSNTILVTSPNIALFKPDTFMRVQYNYGEESDSIYLITNIVPVAGNNDSIYIEVEDNSFPDSLVDFYLQSVNPNPQRISNSKFSISVPNDFIASAYYFAGQKLKLSINGAPTNLVIAVNGVDDTVEGEITFTTVLPNVPAFINGDTRLLSYQSSTPDVSVLYNSYGYIKVLDMKTKTILGGADQTIENLSVACVPRSEYFAKRLWIFNGVDDVMIWDGSVLKVYEEPVKERATSFSKDNDNPRIFAFLTDNSFDITKYQGKTIRLLIFRPNNTSEGITSLVTNITEDVVDPDTKIIHVTLFDPVPDFNGQDSLSVFYFDRLPKFSFMKGAHDRLWCLGEGAVGLEYRKPDLTMRYYYSYNAFSDQAGFGFFNEKTKSVPSEDISAKHGVADNLEAIVQLSGNLVFMGRQNSQVWKGVDPLTEGSSNYFSWSVTLPTGIYHGDLIVELANDAQFLSQNGFASFSTLNIAKQFAASNTPNMDKIATEFMSTIDNNYQYRACGSFKYSGGSFCGFKIGTNDVIVSRFHTSFFWWGLFSGDFTSSSCFLSFQEDSLYLYIGNKIFQYADGFNNSIVMYGDRDETRYINFSETKYVNNIRRRYANKRYEVECDYSSSIIVNPENNINIYISGNLRNTFVLQDVYKLPMRGDLLGTITLVDGSKSGSLDYPNPTALGVRLDIPSHTKKGRLQFVSNNFLVTIVGQIKNGPFVLNKIRLFGIVER